MDKTDEQIKIEEKWYQFWLSHNLFKADPDSSKKPYSLLMPPPNLTGEPHMGHAMQHSILDAVARQKRMAGFDVLLLPGVDHAGIQFESTLNKKLSKEGLTKEKLGRAEWLKKAWQFKDETYQTFHKTWSIFGISADWSREVFTMDPKISQAVLKEFQTFWDEDLLYKGAYIVQWCPKDATTIDDNEMEYEERKEKLYFIKYEIKDSSLEFITVATARPETIFADSGIAVHPNHPKYSKYIGKLAQNPLNGEWIPIFEDSRVDPNFGSGALKITPGHDPLDYQIAIDQNPPLPIKHAIDKTGRMTEQAIYGGNPDETLKGLKILEAKEKTIEILRKKDAIEEEKDYTHSVPVCERCKTTIEPLISEEWFVKMKPLAEKALENLDKVNFTPKNYHQIISDWLENIHDWSISRSLWWGHRIPVWYCEKCNSNHLVGKDKDMKISLEHPEQNCQTCKLNEWVQDDQVLDTWFSSGLWPMATLGWPEENPELKRYYPWSFELSAPEIKFLWIARMIMLGLYFKDAIPFENMLFHGTLRDLQGQKMSKSLGNGIDPIELINQWGTDAVRMTLYSYSAPGRDPKASKQTMDERCKSFRNFSTKLKNIYRFIYELKPEDIATSNESSEQRSNESFFSGAPETSQKNDIASKSNPDDQEIIDQLNQTIQSVTKNIDSFQLHLATEALYEFIWHQFADIYIEKSKTRRVEAQETLEYIFKTSLELLHPFMPFITEELWQKIPHEAESIMITKWPLINE